MQGKKKLFKMLLQKNVPCKKDTSKRLLHMSESVNNKYKLFNIDVLKEPLLRLSSIFLENLQKKGSLPL